MNCITKLFLQGATLERHKYIAVEQQRAYQTMKKSLEQNKHSALIVCDFTKFEMPGGDCQDLIFVVYRMENNQVIFNFNSLFIFF